MPKKSFCVDEIRTTFPAYDQDSDQDFIYLDNAATTQKTRHAIQCMTEYYSNFTANVHRGTHQLSRTQTDDYEKARQEVATFLGCQSSEIVWTKGATEALNLVAYGFAQHQLKAGDIILISEMEHHANIVPWQLIAKTTGAIIEKIPLTPEGLLDLDAYQNLLSPKVKLVAICHISNVTGHRNPIELMTKQAHAIGAFVVIDGAQGIVHESIQLTELKADFYAFSGHKLYSPSGIGVLYIAEKHLKDFHPWQGGGQMIKKVQMTHTEFEHGTKQLEAGTPNVSAALALVASIRWLEGINRDAATKHIDRLQQLLREGISTIEGVTFIGTSDSHGIVSFVIDDIHHSDLATLLNENSIAVRNGHLCAHPLMQALNIKGCIRISIGIYNTESEIQRTIKAIHSAVHLLS